MGAIANRPSAIRTGAMFVIVGAFGLCAACAVAGFFEYSWSVRTAQNAVNGGARGMANWLIDHPPPLAALAKLPKTKRVDLLPPGTTRPNDLGSVRVTLKKTHVSQLFFPSRHFEVSATAAILPGASGTDRPFVVMLH